MRIRSFRRFILFYFITILDDPLSRLKFVPIVAYFTAYSALKSISPPKTKNEKSRLDCAASLIFHFLFSSYFAPLRTILKDVDFFLSFSRIKEFLNPLDASTLIPADKIETKWVVTNASPEWVKLKWNTELPHWILSAIHNLINCTFMNSCHYFCFALTLMKFIIGKNYLNSL